MNYKSNSHYDSNTKKRLDNPEHYDRMIELLMKYNPVMEHNVSFALRTINVCIVEACFDGDHSTGCCAAYRMPSGKIRLFLEPLIPIN